MRIDRLQVRKVTIPYREPIAWAGAVKSSADLVLLQAAADDGSTGFAESHIQVS
jgi:hypothetical protein